MVKVNGFAGLGVEHQNAGQWPRFGGRLDL
jgi:hypothetical protein